MANGDISDGSSDAINGGQFVPVVIPLSTVGSSVDSLFDYSQQRVHDRRFVVDDRQIDVDDCQHAVGLGVYPSQCFNTTASGPQSGSSLCDGGGFGAGITAYDADGRWGGWVKMTCIDDTELGGVGADRFTVTTSGGLDAYMMMNLNANKILNVANGTVSAVSKDAVNQRRRERQSALLLVHIDLDRLSTGVTLLSSGLASLST